MNETVTIRPPAMGQARRMEPMQIDQAIEHVCGLAEALGQQLQSEKRTAELARFASRLEECGRHCRDRIARWQGGTVRYPTTEG